MKVALLGPISSTDKWNIPLSFLHHFNEMGHLTKFYNTLVDDKFDDKHLHRLVADADSKHFTPDIVFHLDFGFFDSPLLDKSRIPTAKWVVESGDDPQNFFLNSPKISSKKFDMVLSPDIRCVRDYTSRGINATWCPYFADPEQFKLEQEPIYHAVTTRSTEEPFFSALKNALGDQFEARTEYLNGLDHSRHLMKGHIVVQNSKYREISRRVFEGMMAQRMVLADRPDPAAEMHLIFEEGKDIVYFDSLDDCVDKIKYYSAHPEERERIAQNGFAKVSAHHTTPKRIEKILQLL